MRDILKILEEDARTTPDQIAVMTGRSVEEVKELIAQAEQQGILLGYHAHVNWEKAGDESVWALIGISARPQRDVGFDALAGLIANYPETKAVTLVSGQGFDLAVLVVGRNLQELSAFVSAKLAALEGVQGTNTHFYLKRYKDQGTVLEGGNGSFQRQAVVP